MIGSALVRRWGPVAASLLVAFGANPPGAVQAQQLTHAPLRAQAQPQAQPARLCDAMRSLGPEWMPVGQSARNRPLLMRRIRGTGPTVLWIGGIHGDEPEGAVATEALPAALAAAGVTGVDLVQLQDANPDGRATRTRRNARGVDLNRNFPTADFDPSVPSHGRRPLSQPESRLVHDVVQAVRPSAIVVIHSWRNATFVNFDGPARQLAEAWSLSSAMPVVASDRLGDSTPGSIGTWAGVERAVSVLTVEYRRGEPPAGAWQRTRSAAVAMLAAAATLPVDPEGCH